MADVAFTARATLIGQFLVGVVRGLAGHNEVARFWSPMLVVDGDRVEKESIGEPTG